MKQLKIVIADDDVASRIILKHFIEFFPDFCFIGEAENGEELVELVLKEKPDIALVDISMPGLNGIDAIKTCKEFLPSLQVIFTTGYDEFAVEAFNISAADYLMKPIERTRLFVALEKAKKSLTLSMNTPNQISRNGNAKLAIKSYNTYIYLAVDDILFIEKEARKTIIHTLNDRFETTDSLQNYEEKLPGYFYKTHRSFFVNLKKVIRIESSGETYLAHFSLTEKVAHISKLKIHEVQALMIN